MDKMMPIKWLREESKEYIYFFAHKYVNIITYIKQFFK